VHGEFQNNKHNSIHETILNWYHVEGHAFWSFTVTGDGTLICHNKPWSKHHNTEWKHPTSPIKKKFKSQPTVGKVTLNTFLRCAWISPEALLRKGCDKQCTLQ
jgi:hypothetical protein